MNDIELARLLLGDSKTSSTSTTSAQSGTSVIPGRTRTYTAVALTDSVDGMVTVRVNGDVVGADGSTAVTLPTQAVVHEGDNVNVVVVNGSPMVTGSAGWGDQVAGTIVAQRIETEQLLATKASIDSLDAQTARIDVLVGDVADFGTLVAGKASIDDLNAATARIGTLETDHVSISDLTAATGRIGDLEADHVSVSDLTAATGRIGDLEADHVSVSDFQAEQGYIDTLQANTADIDTIRANAAKVQNLTAQQLEADHATISALDATYATIDSLDAATGRIGDLEADHVSVADFQAEQGYIDMLQANTADIDTIRANAAKVQNLTAQQLEADHATIGSLSTTYAQIDMANVDNSWIQNGTIKEGAITNAMINSVSANKLTAGTIDASAITVTNLNASNITTGTINGQRIGTGSLSLDKLSEDVYTESEVDAKLSSMQDQIDGAIETWTGTAVPTLNNAPASSWTTTADRDKHVGDVYFVVNSNSQQNGYNYRFTKSGSTYSWQLIKDNDVTQALSRLSAAEGKITSIEAFDSDISSWKTDTDEELASYKSRTTSLETRVTDAENDISEKVDTSTFNTLSQTVDGNSSSITNLSTVVTNNGLTSSTNITNTVNTVSQTATGNSSKITQLTTTLGTNADGTSKDGDIVHRTSAVEQDLSGFKTTVSNTYATTTALGGVESTANNANNKLVAYSGTSSTAATTTTKVVACTNFALSAGATITVRFSVANTATNAISLNVNSTGAKQIYVNGAVTGSTNQLLWATNANITFTYDGTYWRVDSEPRSWYGSCSTANSTAAKTATINEVVICKGTQVVLNMTNDNTNTSATLNVTSTAAKNIYYGTTTTRPTTENGYGWTAASTATFVFDGAYWRIGDTSAMSKITATNAVVSQHTTKIDQNANAIALKADSSTTYTKTDVDGLISTEVTNRNAAITAASNAINLSVSEIYNKVSSRGEQLVTNGNGLMGDNTNYPSLTFDGSVANGSPGSFTHTPQYYVCFPEEKFPIDPSAEYIVSCDAISEDGTAKAYGCVLTYDVDGLSIEASQVGYVAGSLTTLARELKSGDTTVYLTDVSGFMTQTYASHQRSLRFWDYTNSYGYMYPPETYTRNITVADTWAADSSINRSTNTIALKTAYSGPTHAAGTYVSEGLNGSTYLYFFGPSTIPSTWTSYSRLLSGSVTDGNPNTFAFRPGTAFCGIGFLWNYGMSSSAPQGRMWVTNVSMMKSSPSASEFATAAAQISVNAGNIESKVSKNGVISSINQSSESITIDANRVNIAGAAIFTSGRLSETTLNNTYATPDDIPSKVSDLTNDSGFQTASQVNTTITEKGYQTASQVESAITGKDYATKAQANDQEQLIYISAVANTSSKSGTTQWVTDSTGSQNKWTTKRPQYSSSYPVLFVATQRKSVSGSVTCTTPVKDDTTTVIDGGHITTGTIDASRATITNINASNISSGTLSTNRLDAATITSNIVQTAELNANKITSGTLSTNRLDAATITSNIVQTAELNASKITSGTLSTNRLDAATIVSNIVQTAELNASKITSGTLSADRIDAGTLSVEKILVADQERVLNYKLSDTINDIRDSLENLSETTTTDISTITDRVNDLDAELDTKLDGEYLKEWLKADAGKLELGRTGGGTTVKAVLDSEKLTFENQGKAVATYGGIAGMSVPNATVESELHIGGFMLVKRNNGHLTLKYVG